MFHRFLTTALFLHPDGDGGAGGSGNAGNAGNNQEGSDPGTPEGSGGQNGGNTDPEGGNQNDFDESGWDDKTKKYINSLRKENARYRTEAKDSRTKLESLSDRFGKLEGGLKQALGIEGDDTPLEEQVAGLTEVNQNLEFKLAIRDIADEAGIIGSDACSYFEYLVSQEAAKLDENGEISDERMGELIATVKKLHGNKSTGSTSVGDGENGKGGNTPPPAGNSNDVTLEEFCMMGTLKKGELFGKNPALYNSLMKQAKEKGLIV